MSDPVGIFSVLALALAMQAPSSAVSSGDASTPAAGLPTEAAAQATSAAPQVIRPKDQIKCRSVRYTGSRFPVRECMTEGQRQARAERNQDFKDKYQRRGSDMRSRYPGR